MWHERWHAFQRNGSDVTNELVKVWLSQVNKIDLHPETKRRIKLLGGKGLINIKEQKKEFILLRNVIHRKSDWKTSRFFLFLLEISPWTLMEWNVKSCQWKETSDFQRSFLGRNSKLGAFYFKNTRKKEKTRDNNVLKTCSAEKLFIPCVSGSYLQVRAER